MNSSFNSSLNKILKQIELPGEEEEKIKAYLEDKKFVDLVMEKTGRMGQKTQKTALWGIFALLNLLLLFVLGTNDFIMRDFFAFQHALSQLFFLFLGLTLSGSLIGFVLSIDTSWFDRLIHRDV